LGSFPGPCDLRVGILADRFADDDVVAVFTHGGLKNEALDHFYGREKSRTMHTFFDNGSISTVELNGAGQVVHSVNDVSHLR
jgi:broad specificity phosphatase PhoE